ncbi:MAG: hypothetical protein EA350_17720 [Gemmatimonadales bacterium]|nr:MAG: hypothetical protein EA350_17720 [Gemmatimonadales bacterium]
MVEGMPEVMAVQAFETPVSFPLGFSTVVPADMRVEQVGSGEGDVVRFEAAFGGVHRPEALLSLTVLPGDLSESEAREQFASVAAVLGAGPHSGERFPWALQERMLIGDVSGFVALGRHQDRWYLMAMQHPPEYGDGMAPRVDLMLRRWRWTSDGSPLHPGEPRAGDGT